MPKTAVPDWVHDKFEYTLTMHNPAGAAVVNVEMNREEYEGLKRVLAIRRGYIKPEPPNQSPPTGDDPNGTITTEERFSAFMQAPIRKP